MQALFSFCYLVFAAYTAVLIEVDSACFAFTAAIAVLHVSITAGYRVGCAKGAFNVCARHTGKNSLFYQGVPFCAPGDEIPASIVLSANYRKASG